MRTRPPYTTPPRHRALESTSSGRAPRACNRWCTLNGVIGVRFALFLNGHRR
jgi:hypothetical protein